MGLQGSIFNGPILDSSNLGRDGRGFIRLEYPLLLSPDGDIELNRPVSSTKLLGEKKRALGGDRLVLQPGKLEFIHRYLRFWRGGFCRLHSIGGTRQLNRRQRLRKIKVAGRARRVTQHFEKGIHT